jgi:tetratricopeptide (TPR) repeat protein
MILPTLPIPSTTSRFIVWIAAAAALLIPCAAAADRYELQVHDDEVYGKYALLEGNIDVSIERLERKLARTRSHRDLAPVLINLCAAYTMKRDFEKAEERCDAAIDNGWSVSMAYNNRGIMNVAKGDYLTAVDDFESAADRASTTWVRRHLLLASNRIEAIESDTQLAGVSDGSPRQLDVVSQ